MNDPLLRERLNQLDPTYREFVESGFAATAAVQFGTVQQFTETQIAVLENAVMLYLLFFLNKADLQLFIEHQCEVTPAVAEELMIAITEMFPSDFSVLQAKAYTLFHTAPAASPTSTTADLASDIAETESAISAAAVPPIRIMAADLATQQSATPATQPSVPAAVHYPPQQPATPPAAAPSVAPISPIPANLPVQPAPVSPTDVTENPNVERTYTSNQEALLRERPKQTETPPTLAEQQNQPAPYSDEARWGSS